MLNAFWSQLPVLACAFTGFAVLSQDLGSSEFDFVFAKRERLPNEEVESADPALVILISVRLLVFRRIPVFSS